MIDKSYGRYQLICDICGEQFEESFETFQDVVEGKDTLGWKSQKTSKGWEDTCPICKSLKIK